MTLLEKNMASHRMFYGERLQPFIAYKIIFHKWLVFSTCHHGSVRDFCLIGRSWNIALQSKPFKQFFLGFRLNGVGGCLSVILRDGFGATLRRKKCHGLYYKASTGEFWTEGYRRKCLAGT